MRSELECDLLAVFVIVAASVAASSAVASSCFVVPIFSAVSGCRKGTEVKGIDSVSQDFKKFKPWNLEA